MRKKMVPRKKPVNRRRMRYCCVCSYGYSSFIACLLLFTGKVEGGKADESEGKDSQRTAVWIEGAG